jgi:hypothetical protein
MPCAIAVRCPGSAAAFSIPNSLKKRISSRVEAAGGSRADAPQVHASGVQARLEWVIGGREACQPGHAGRGREARAQVLDGSRSERLEGRRSDRWATRSRPFRA